MYTYAEYIRRYVLLVAKSGETEQSNINKYVGKMDSEEEFTRKLNLYIKSFNFNYKNKVKVPGYEGTFYPEDVAKEMVIKVLASDVLIGRLELINGKSIEFEDPLDKS